MMNNKYILWKCHDKDKSDALFKIDNNRIKYVYTCNKYMDIQNYVIHEQLFNEIFDNQPHIQWIRSYISSITFSQYTLFLPKELNNIIENYIFYPFSLVSPVNNTPYEMITVGTNLFNIEDNIENEIVCKNNEEKKWMLD